MAAVSDADYKPCPHCGRALHKWTRNRHIAACPQRPEIAAALRAALTGADGCAVSGDEYAARAAGTDLPGMTALIKHFGTLRAAAAHFGLRARDAAGATCTRRSRRNVPALRARLYQPQDAPTFVPTAPRDCRGTARGVDQ